jgi:hypothetical protein
MAEAPEAILRYPVVCAGNDRWIKGREAKEEAATCVLRRSVNDSKESLSFLLQTHLFLFIFPFLLSFLLLSLK